MASSYWFHGKQRTTRERLVAMVRDASARADALRMEANRAQRVFLKRKTPQGMANAEAAWMNTERALVREQDKARRISEEIAAGDARKRKDEPRRRGPTWRYHPRFSSNSVKSKFNQIEVYFQRKDGARMSEHEVLQAVTDLAEGQRRSDLVVGSVQWGRRLHKRSSHTRAVASDFHALIRYGQFDNIGEEQL